MSINYCSYVDIENISFFENLIFSGNSVTDDIIERYTSIATIGSLPLSPFIVSEIVDAGGFPSI